MTHVAVTAVKASQRAQTWPQLTHQAAAAADPPGCSSPFCIFCTSRPASGRRSRPFTLRSPVPARKQAGHTAAGGTRQPIAMPATSSRMRALPHCSQLDSSLPGQGAPLHEQPSSLSPCMASHHQADQQLHVHGVQSTHAISAIVTVDGKPKPYCSATRLQSSATQALNFAYEPGSDCSAPAYRSSVRRCVRRGHSTVGTRQTRSCLWPSCG